jgi:hypothetical protein
MKGEARREVSRAPLHSITTPSSEIIPWEGSISSKHYLRIQTVPQREHRTSLLQRSTG